MSDWMVHYNLIVFFLMRSDFPIITKIFPGYWVLGTGYWVLGTGYSLFGLPTPNLSMTICQSIYIGITFDNEEKIFLC